MVREKIKNYRRKVFTETILGLIGSIILIVIILIAIT
jgi:hypothetical protein